MVRGCAREGMRREGGGRAKERVKRERGARKSGGGCMYSVGFRRSILEGLREDSLYLLAQAQIKSFYGYNPRKY